MANQYQLLMCLFSYVLLTISNKTDHGNSTTKIDLYIGGLFGVNVKNGSWSTAGVIPALEMALEHVNSDPGILVNYQLKYVWNDSRCESGAGIRAMLELINTQPHKIVFLGPGCSLATEPIAEAAPYWQAVQIGYSASSPQFSNKEKYPLYFRTATSETMENPARVALFKHFKWKRVALIVENFDIFVTTKEDLIPRLKESNITVIAEETFIKDPSSSVKNLLKEKDARIIIGLMYEDMFKKAMCTAYKQGLFGNKYVWIIVGWYLEDWWTKTDEECTGENLLKAASNLILTSPLRLSNSPQPTISNKTAQQLNSTYEERCRHSNFTSHEYASFTYDAVWTIALMLNKSIPLLGEKNKTFETIKYGDKETAEIMKDILFRTNFTGMSGHVSFDRYGDRQTVVLITQKTGDRKRLVATMDVRDGKLQLYGDGFEWAGGRVPADGVKITQKIYHEGIKTTVSFYVLASSGILLCLFCLLFNFKYRNHSFIRMSSPNFNNITVIGCMLAYLEIFLLARGTSGSAEHLNHAFLCNVSVWLLTTSFTFAFGGIFVKTWRVYKIFTNYQLKKEIPNLGSISLLALLLAGWSIDVIFLSTWTSVDPLTTKFVIISKTVDNNDPDLVEELLTRQCTSHYYNTWVMSLCGLKGILLIFGVFLAWETRNVHYPSLNDSKSIGLAVYNMFMFSCLAIVVGFVVYPALKTLVQRSIVFVAATSTVALLFVPKIKVYMALSASAYVSRDFTSHVSDNL